jgi:anti-sigma regulatory factor (Ser/Thr protein kinase)
MTELPKVELLARDFDYHSLVQVRHEIEHTCAAAGLTEHALYWFVVAVNEITTNAVRHGGGRGRLHLWREDNRLRCRVVDRGPGIPPDRHGEKRPSPYTLGGRGLWLARQGCESVMLDTGPHGSVVTLIQPIRQLSSDQVPGAGP